MAEIIVIAYNIRSIYNVGSIFRTCEGFGVPKLILSGYTPFPKIVDDTRLPHITTRLNKEIHKSALGAEHMVPFEYQEIPDLNALRSEGFTIAGLEQDQRSLSIQNYTAPQKVALILGEEVHGLSDELKSECEVLLEIPMKGRKESFNVSVATGIALYALTNSSG